MKREELLTTKICILLGCEEGEGYDEYLEVVHYLLNKTDMPAVPDWAKIDVFRIVNEYGYGSLEVIEESDPYELMMEKKASERAFEEWFKQFYGVEYDTLNEEYIKECQAIAEECEEEGFPSYGSNYELRVESLQKTAYFMPLFECDEEYDEYLSLNY